MTSSSNHLKNLGALSVNVIGSSERFARTILFFSMWRFTALSIAAGKIPHPPREVNENVVRTASQGMRGLSIRFLMVGVSMIGLQTVGPVTIGPVTIGHVTVGHVTVGTITIGLVMV